MPAQTGPAYWGPGDQVTFLITGAETGGAFFMAEVLVRPGGGPPPHLHQREEESFHLLGGTLSIQVGGTTVHASPEDFVHLPRGVGSFVPEHWESGCKVRACGHASGA
jgi:quercetin dioxygenase-like cupin family protein